MDISIKNSLESSANFQTQKQLIEEDVKVQQAVSYIYYPAPNDFPILGHAELEIAGESWTLLGEPYSKPLSKIISSSLEGRGSPFFRFEISVTSDELNTLKNQMKEAKGCTCSDKVCHALSKYGNYSVLFPFSVSPLASALYLTTAKMLGSSRIKKIEFYGDPQRPLTNIVRCSPGILLESIYISSIAYTLWSLK